MQTHPASDVAFTASVKAEQTLRGSRGMYEHTGDGEGQDWETTITPKLREFIAARDSVYLATASKDGQPYIQHRGGPKGFLRLIDEATLAFADVAGNRQFISLGNLAENEKAFLFLMDYERRRRIKIWGRARVSNDPELLAKVTAKDLKGRAERVIVFDVVAWDANCPAYIPQKIDAREALAVVTSLRARVTELEAENEALRAAAALRTA